MVGKIFERVRFVSGAERNTLKQLKWASRQYKTFKVYTKENTPDHWKVTRSRRSPPILLVANEGYAFDDLRESIVEYGKRWNFTRKLNCTRKF